MENKDTFKMTYSAEQQEELHHIRQKYLPQEPDKMQQLRVLDAGAAKKATMDAIVAGVLGAMLLGCGMSLIMTDFGSWLGRAALPVGVAVGVSGMLLMALAYPLYSRSLRREREKIAPEILRLTDELMR